MERVKKLKTWQVLVGAGIAAVVAIALAFALSAPDEERLVVVNSDSGVRSDIRGKEPIKVQVDDAGQRIPEEVVRDVAAAALAAAGGGVVTEIERSDDPGEAFEVEVQRGGIEIDIALDDQLRRVKNERFSD